MVCFQRLVLLSVLEFFVSAPFDQCDQWKRNKGRAQSEPTHAKGHPEQVRYRPAPTFQSIFIFSKRVSPFSVLLEQLNLQTESFRFAAPGAHSPQINGQLTGHSHNGFPTRCSYWAHKEAEIMKVSFVRVGALKDDTVRVRGTALAPGDRVE